MSSPAIFLDRDGTLMADVDYPNDPAQVHVFPGVRESLEQLRDAGFTLVIITNQSGLGRGLITPEQFRAVQERLFATLGRDLIKATYFCPDLPGAEAVRRKPHPTMVLEAAHDLDLDLRRSWFIGDRRIDVECGRAAGVRPILVLTGQGDTGDGTGAVSIAEDFVTATRFVLENQKSVS
jgi:histidinol-phosphate phosphatase family protein